MKVIRSREALQAQLANWQKAEKTIGFVPTMGFLHEGHLQLVQQAQAENDHVVLSIFVNPMQFGPNEDFDAYPRDEAHDQLLAKQQGVDILFMPSAPELYPAPLTMMPHVVRRADVLDGAEREGHFDGVVAVLLKLFQLIRPTRAYFGQKDIQQVAVVQGFVRDYFLPLEIVVVPTVREVDGLAKSSRNVYLTAAERKAAPAIHQALLAGRALIERGETEEAVILRAVYQRLKQQTVEHELVYLAIYSFPEFQPVTDWDAPLVIAAAVRYSQARLIDNELIKKKAVIADA